MGGKGSDNSHMIPASLRKIIDAQKAANDPLAQTARGNMCRALPGLMGRDAVEKTWLWNDGTACKESPGRKPVYFKWEPNL